MSHQADYKRAEKQIDTLIHQMHMKGETPARLRKLRSLEAKRDKALERWARTEAWKGNPKKSAETIAKAAERFQRRQAAYEMAKEKARIERLLREHARSEAERGNPSFKMGKRGQWVNASAFRVRTQRKNGRSYTVVDFRPPKTKNPRSRIRVGPMRKRKVARRVGSALKSFMGRRNSGGRSRRR